MEMEKYRQLRQLIDANHDIVEFGDFGEGVSDYWIEKTETALGLPLPDSYKWWVGNYGGGEIAGEEIFSIYEDPQGMIGGDIVYMYQISSARNMIQPTSIPVCNSDIDGLFYFDCSARRADGEYPIISAHTGNVYAEDFVEFLTKRILACAGE